MERPEETLDDVAKLNAIDRKGMLGLIDKLPDMMEEGWAAAEALQLPELGEVANLVISGMGGSAISGDIVSHVIREKAAFPVIVNRSYSCPRFVNKNTLFIAVSYSGNTEETISAFKEALSRKAKIISITSGGELKELSDKNNVPFIVIPKGLPPRAALGYLLAPLLNVLYKTGLSHIKADFMEASKLLKQLLKKRSASCATRENEVKQMAARLSGKIPVILATEGTTYAAGLRWKTQINENSKMTALFTVFPELNHNDLVNFSFLRSGEHDYSFVLLRDEHDLERMKKRIEITKSLISGYVGGIAEVSSQGKTALERMMSLIQFGDYLSVYLAELAGIDPTPVEIIEKLKKELAR